MYLDYALLLMRVVVGLSGWAWRTEIVRLVRRQRHKRRGENARVVEHSSTDDLGVHQRNRRIWRWLVDRVGLVVTVTLLLLAAFFVFMPWQVLPL